MWLHCPLGVSNQWRWSCRLGVHRWCGQGTFGVRRRRWEEGRQKGFGGILVMDDRQRLLVDRNGFLSPSS